MKRMRILILAAWAAMVLTATGCVHRTTVVEPERDIGREHEYDHGHEHDHWVHDHWEH